jgi:hypothetical protein
MGGSHVNASYNKTPKQVACLRKTYIPLFSFIQHNDLVVVFLSFTFSSFVLHIYQQLAISSTSSIKFSFK